MIRPLSVEWKYTTPLTTTSPVIVGVGGASGLIYPIADCRGLSFFRWQAWFNNSADAILDMRLTVEVALSPSAFADLVPPGVDRFRTLFTHDIAEGVLTSTYDMAGVYAGNPGWITLQWPYVRISLANLDGTNDQTELDFYAIAWG